MIKSLRVRNFKVFEDVTFDFGDVDRGSGKVSVIVGPSGSGKSALVDAFLLLKQVMGLNPDAPNPFAKWGGYEKVVFMNNKGKDISLEVTGVIKGQGEYKYNVTLNSNIIENERIEETDKGVCYKRDKNGNISDCARNKDVGTVTGNTSMVFYLYRNNCEKTYKGKETQTGEACTILNQLMNGIGVFRVVPSVAASPVPITFPEDMMEETGRGLPMVLLNYLIGRKKGKYIDRSATRFIDKFIDRDLRDMRIIPKPTLTAEGYVRLLFVRNTGEVSSNSLEGSGNEVDASYGLVPDGVLKMLVLLAAMDVLGLSTIVVDELENSLHPAYLEFLMDVVRSSGKQLIATTNSPAVVDLLDPSEVILLKREGNNVTATKLDPVVKQRLREEGRYLNNCIGRYLSDYLFY